MNGVPMRRVNQAYVIATSMSVDVSKVKIPATDDSYFTREETAKKTDEDQFFEQAAKVKQALVQHWCRRYAKLPHGEGPAVAVLVGYNVGSTVLVFAKMWSTSLCKPAFPRGTAVVFSCFSMFWCRSMAGFSSGGLLVARSCHPKPNCSRNDSLDVRCMMRP